MSRNWSGRSSRAHLFLFAITHFFAILAHATQDDATPVAQLASSSLDLDEVQRRQAQPIVPRGIVADTPMKGNAVPGTTLYYSFDVAPTATPQPRQRDSHYEMKRSDDSSVPKDDAEYDLDSLDDELQARQSGGTVWVSINTCQNPKFNNDADAKNPPQLSLLVQTVASGFPLGSTLPSPLKITLDQGYAMRGIVVSSGAVIVGVAPPDVDINKAETAFTYNVAVSKTAAYHNVMDNVDLSLKLVDSDQSAGLLITENLQGWSNNVTNKTVASLDHGPPFGVFASNINYTQLNGLQNSYCALEQSSQVGSELIGPRTPGLEMGIIHNKPGNELEQQIYLPGLNATSTYLGRLATINGTKFGDGARVNGGGTLYPLMNFTTKTSSNCAVLFNLSFCADVNYAVPANPSRYNRADLSALYDNQTAALFQNFTWSLQQVPCNTTPTAQYSLAVGCDNCTAAYKTWLCAVTIPKCADFSEHYDPAALPGGIGHAGDKQFPENELADGGNVQIGGFNDWGWLMPRNLAQAPLNGSVGLSDRAQTANNSQLSWLATNSSRNNATIADKIQPGPYLEILPCEDLCYDLVRMCPASLQFSCPKPGSMLMRASYGQRGTAKGSGAYTCNAPGAVYFKNGANRLAWSSSGFVVAAAVAAFLLA